MLLPKRTSAGLRAMPQITRYLSTTGARPWAAPTNRYPPSGPRAAEKPVDDIDLVFDYPSEGQTSHQKQPLEQSGLDLHSAMPHYPESRRSVPYGKRMDKEMGYPENNVMYRYIGLGALGLGALYMMMGRRSARSNMTHAADLAAQKPSESRMGKVLGRGR